MDNKKKIIKMYVSKSALSLTSVKTIKDAIKNTNYKLEIIDIVEHPEEAEQENILATPTVIKKLPPPIRKIIGQLIDKEKILMSLDIVEN